MPRVDRFSVSLDTELLAAFDRHIADRGYGTRSEAIRDMIRSLLTEARLTDDQGSVVAVLNALFDYRVTRSSKCIRDILLTSPDVVARTLTTAIDEDRDALTIVLRGPATGVGALADRIQATKGVSNGSLWQIPGEM